MQIIRYGMVGILNTLIDFLTSIILAAIWGMASGLPLVLCNAAAAVAPPAAQLASRREGKVR